MVATPLNRSAGADAQGRRRFRFGLRRLLAWITLPALLFGTIDGWLAYQSAQRGREDRLATKIALTGASMQRAYCGPKFFARWWGEDRRLLRINQVWCDNAEVEWSAFAPLVGELGFVERLLVFGRHVFRSNQGAVEPDPEAIATLRQMVQLKNLLVDVSPRSQTFQANGAPSDAARDALRSCLPGVEVTFLEAH